MAWIYLAESVDSVWPLHHSSDLSPTVRMTDSLKLFFCLGCNQVNLRPQEFGTTSPRSYLSCCPEKKLISSTAVSRARILALLEAERAWKESEADFFLKSQDLLVQYDQNSFSWKTSQLLLSEDFQKSLESFPSWGMTLGGRLFQPKKLEPVIYEDDGLCLPTPMASRCGYQSQGNGEKRYMIPELWKMGKIPTPLAREGKSYGSKSDMKRKSPSVSIYWKATTGTTMPVSFIEWIMGYRFGATVLEDWAMQWFRNKQEKHL